MLAMKNLANSVLLLYLGNSAFKRMRQDEHVASNYSDQQDRSTVAESRPRPRHGRRGEKRMRKVYAAARSRNSGKRSDTVSQRKSGKRCGGSSGGDGEKLSSTLMVSLKAKLNA